MYDEFGAPMRRSVRRQHDVEELSYLAQELEDGGAFVSSGRMPWLGLSGRDPYDEVPDEEFGLRQWEDWHDAGMDEDERPTRRRPSGQEQDVVPPVVHEVEVRVDPAIAAEFAARQAEAAPGASWAVDGGRVTTLGDVKTWHGSCAQCSKSFEQRRPVSQRRRWRKLCGAACAELWERERAAERKRRARRSEAA
ncbi:hypothetical protein [Streptomyces sp. NPDC056105]|uniref:hypothetical protein n=1 Tax=Streptomyces sp. NPDC056105 TaxID=3345714 RepID=UPI0035D648B2